MPQAITANTLGRRLDEWQDLEAKVAALPSEAEERKKLVQLVDQKAAGIVQDLSRLSEPQRQKLAEGIKDKQKTREQLAALGADRVAGDDQTGAIFAQVLAQKDWQNLAAVAADSTRQGTVQTVGAGPMGLEAVLNGLHERQGKAVRKLTETEQKARAEHPSFQETVATIQAVAGGSFHEEAAKGMQQQLEFFRKQAERPDLDQSAKEIARANFALAQKGLNELKANKVNLGIEAAGLADDPLFAEVLAHGLGLPSTLSKKQKAYLDSLVPAGTERLAGLTGLVGGTESIFGKIVAAVGSGDEEAKRALARQLVGLDKVADNPEDATAAQAKQAAQQAIAGVGKTGTVSEADSKAAHGDAKIAERLAWLRENHKPAYEAVTTFYAAQESYQRKAEATYNEIMNLLKSGLPIEMVIMMVMMRLTERQEEKFQLKIKEMAAAEQIEGVNRPVRERIGYLQQTGQFEKVAEEEKKLVEPLDFGIKTKSTTILMQELQVEMQYFMQVMQALAGVLREMQDLVMTPVRNIRS